jgi:hypothetical protein
MHESIKLIDCNIEILSTMSFDSRWCPHQYVIATPETQVNLGYTVSLVSAFPKLHILVHAGIAKQIYLLKHVNF